MHTDLQTFSVASERQVPDAQPPRSTLTRRSWLAGAALGLLGPTLAGCGGGTSDGPGPQIDTFALDNPALQVGDTARLRVAFRGGAGRIEPGIGPVSSGTVVEVPALNAARRYRLVVSATGWPNSVRELTLDPGWRERLRSFDAPAMAGHATVALPDGTALVIGGSRGESVLSSAIERFDPATQRFTAWGSLASGRSEHSAVLLGEGRVLVFGGSTSTVQPPFAELIDLRQGTVSAGGSMMLSRTQHATVQLADGRVAAVGGWGRNSIELWDPATRTWALAANRMAHVRSHPTASLLPDGRVLIVGGQPFSPTPVFAEIFDPANQTFTPVAGAPAGSRWLHAALTLSDGSVLIVGGEDEFGALASVWRFDPAAQRFVAQPPIGSPRSVVRAVLTPADEVLMYGGEAVADEGLRSGERGRAGVYRALPELPTARAWHTLTRLADGRLLLLGGQHRTALVGGGALFD